MVITVLWLFAATGGVFASSGCFVDMHNDAKLYIVMLSTCVSIAVLSLYKKPFDCLRQNLGNMALPYGLMTISFLLSVQGLLQFFDILQSSHIAFKVTGSFDNPAGFAAVQSLLFALSLYHSFKGASRPNVRIVSIIVSIMAFITVVLSESRSGFLAMSSSILVVICCKTGLKKQLYARKWLLPLLLLVILVLFVFLYNLKVESANGRLFIWRICLNIVKETPLLGLGYNSFLSNYMSFQAEYFASHEQSPYSLLADNINHPFNEYIKLAVEFGFLGLFMAMFLAFVVIKKIWHVDNGKRALGLSVVSAVMTMSMFSYPFNYPVYSFILVILLMSVLFTKGTIESAKRRWIRKIITILSVIMTAHIVNECYYNMKWSKIYKQSLNGDTEKMLPHYEQMMSKLGNDPYFLYNYSAELNYIGRYKESKAIAEKCIVVMNDYDVQMLLANNCLKLCEYDESLIRYEIASNMIPSRFTPLWEMMKLYMLRSDTVNAVKIAKEILLKPIKIPSNEIFAMQADAEKIIERYQSGGSSGI